MRSANDSANAALAAQVTNVAKTSRQIPVIIPAGVMTNNQITPGEFAVTQSGNFFYVIATSAPVQIQPVRGGFTGAVNTFGSGQGQPVGNSFDTLTIKNPTLYSIVALIWVGYDSFINDQLLLQSSNYTPVVYPTYPTASAASIVNIPDLSGQPFFDINGKKWGALSRICILVFNVDSGTTINLQKAGSTSSSGVAVGVSFPLTPTRFDFSGDYCFNLGGAPINLIVSEIYNSIPL